MYQAPMRKVNASLAAAIVTLGSGLAAAGFGAWAWFYAMSTYGPAAVRRWTSPWLVAAPLLTVIGVICLLRVWRLTRFWVEAFPDGLRVHRGRRTEQMAWADVREIRTWPGRPPGPAFTRLEIRLASGRKARFSRTLGDLESLARHVKQGAYPLLQDTYRSAFNRGEQLNFGPLRLTAEGVHGDRKFIEWGRLKSVEVRGGRLTITSGDAPTVRLRFAAERIPNVDLCVQIIRLLGQVP